MPSAATVLKQQVVAADAGLEAARAAAVKACAFWDRDPDDDPAVQAIDRAADRLRSLEYSLLKMQRRAEFYRRWLIGLVPSKIVKKRLCELEGKRV